MRVTSVAKGMGRLLKGVGGDFEAGKRVKTKYHKKNKSLTSSMVLSFRHTHLKFKKIIIKIVSLQLYYIFNIRVNDSRIKKPFQKNVIYHILKVEKVV